jgi:hypothetical protein
MGTYRLKFNYDIHINGIGKIVLADGCVVEHLRRIAGEWDKVEGFYIRSGKIERGVWNIRDGKSKEENEYNLISKIGDNEPYPGCTFKIRNGHVGNIEKLLEGYIVYSIIGLDWYSTITVDEFRDISIGVDYSKYFI